MAVNVRSYGSPRNDQWTPSPDRIDPASTGTIFRLWEQRIGANTRLNEDVNVWEMRGNAGDIYRYRTSGLRPSIRYCDSGSIDYEHEAASPPTVVSMTAGDVDSDKGALVGEGWVRVTFNSPNSRLLSIWLMSPDWESYTLHTLAPNEQIEETVPVAHPRNYIIIPVQGTVQWETTGTPPVDVQSAKELRFVEQGDTARGTALGPTELIVVK